jgi:YfiH family protein
MGGTVGDEFSRVIQNRKLAFDALNLDPQSLFDVWQVHGTTVALATKPRSQNEEHQKADIILTNNPKITLMMRFADCTPILLHDPVKCAIGLVHAGWMGTVKSAAKVAIKAMMENFGSKPGDIQAVIGPSIGPDHYEIGADVVTQVQKTFKDDSRILIKRSNGKIYFDLWEGNKKLLLEAGVNKIEIAGLCTACNLEDWFSHRAEKGKTGRFGVLASMELQNEH